MTIIIIMVIITIVITIIIIITIYNYIIIYMCVCVLTIFSITPLQTTCFKKTTTQELIGPQSCRILPFPTFGEIAALVAAPKKVC